MEFLADFLLELILLAVLGAVISTLYRFRSALTDWFVEQETMNPVSLAKRALGSLRDWVGQQAGTYGSWFWAVIVLVCWTVIVTAMGCSSAVLVAFALEAQWPFSVSDWMGIALIWLLFLLPIVAVLVGIAWGGVVIARRSQAIGGTVLAIWGLLLSIPIGYLLTLIFPHQATKGFFGSGSVPDTLLLVGGCGFGLPLVGALPLAIGIALIARRPRVRTEELADFAPKPHEFPDFSPMPDEFANFARMLEEAKEKSGTLICFECGHHNSVGQAQCEECGAWVPQTAKARWAYQKGK